MLFSSRVTLFLLTICLFTGVLVADQRTFGAEMQPLDDILQTEDSVHMTLYAMTRCAALYNTASALFAKREDTLSVSQQHEQMARTMAGVAMMWAKQSNITLTTNELRANMEVIQDAYVERWDVNMAKTGHSFGDMTKEDYLMCKEFYEALNQ